MALEKRLPPVAAPDVMKEQLEALATDMGVSVSWLVREALTGYLKRPALGKPCLPPMEARLPVVAVSATMKEQVRETARVLRLSVSELIRDALVRYLAEMAVLASAQPHAYPFFIAEVNRGE